MKKLLRVLKWIGIVIISLIVVLGVIYVVLPKGPRDPMTYEDRMGQPRTLFTGETYAVVTGTPGATDAALQILECETPTMPRSPLLC
jgi:gamma-glutamyltranspeptidase/glutathione hydrolase